MNNELEEAKKKLHDDIVAYIRAAYKACGGRADIAALILRLDLKPERLVADDGEEHYFIPKLHRVLESLKAKPPFPILRITGPLSKIQKKGTAK